MTDVSFENIDLACAELGQKLAEYPSKELEKCITDALAVLEEQGLYALFLYLGNQKKDEIGDKITSAVRQFMEDTPKTSHLLPKSGEKDILVLVREEIASNLDKLILARDLVHQALVYARYHAKMRQKDGAHS